MWATDAACQCMPRPSRCSCLSVRQDSWHAGWRAAHQLGGSGSHPLAGAESTQPPHSRGQHVNQPTAYQHRDAAGAGGMENSASICFGTWGGAMQRHLQAAGMQPRWELGALASSIANGRCCSSGVQHLEDQSVQLFARLQRSVLKSGCAEVLQPGCSSTAPEWQLPFGPHRASTDAATWYRIRSAPCAVSADCLPTADCRLHHHAPTHPTGAPCPQPLHPHAGQEHGREPVQAADEVPARGQGGQEGAAAEGGGGAGAGLGMRGESSGCWAGCRGVKR